MKLTKLEAERMLDEFEDECRWCAQMDRIETIELLELKVEILGAMCGKSIIPSMPKQLRSTSAQ